MTTPHIREIRFAGLPDEIEIWLATLPAEGQEVVAEGDLPLSAEEWARAKRFMSPVRRRQFVAGRRLLRAVLGRLLGVAPESVALELTPTGRPVLKSEAAKTKTVAESQQYPTMAESIPPHPTPSLSAGGEGAREPTPRLQGDRGGLGGDYRTEPETPVGACAGERRLQPAFNLAHAGDLVIVAVARDGRSVGVDVECVASDTDWRGIAGQFLAEAEREALETLPEAERRVAFFTLWARKEALAKGWKHGAAAPSDEYAVAADPAQPAALLACDFDPQAPGDWAIADLPLAVEGYVGALAYERKAKGERLSRRQ